MIQTILIGSGDRTGDGESIRNAFSKINNNFAELQDYIGLVDDKINNLSIPDINNFTTLEDIAIQAPDIDVTSTGSIRLESSVGFELVNTNSDAPIRIVTDSGDAAWGFNADGTVVFPDNTIQTTAYPGPPTGFFNGDTGAFVLPGGNIVFQVDGAAPVAVVNSEGIDVNKIITGGSTGSNLTITTTAGGDIFIDADATGGLLLASQSGEAVIGRIGGTTDIYGEVEFNNGTTQFQTGNSVDFNCDVDFSGATVTGLRFVNRSTFSENTTITSGSANLLRFTVYQGSQAFDGEFGDFPGQWTVERSGLYRIDFVLGLTQSKLDLDIIVFLFDVSNNSNTITLFNGVFTGSTMCMSGTTHLTAGTRYQFGIIQTSGNDIVLDRDLTSVGIEQLAIV